MARFIDGLINRVTITPQPDLRAECLALLSMELDRAANEVFCETPAFPASDAYTDAFHEARRKREIAETRRWVSHETLDLPLHWLDLLSYRLAAERGLLSGGFGTLTLVASETLGYPSGEVRRWSVGMYFCQFKNTKLRQEWDYPGTQFRMADMRRFPVRV